MTNAKADTNNATGPDPFDPARYRLDSQQFDVEVEHVLTTVPVRKPSRTEFFRVHPDPAFVADMTLLERSDGMDRETYLVDASVAALVQTELRAVRMYTAINKHHKVFLFPVRLPSADGDQRLRRMSDSALRGAEQAKTLWTKLAWDKSVGAWEMYRAKGDLGEPVWPEKSFRDLFELAFRGNVIDSADHVVIRELEGEL